MSEAIKLLNGKWGLDLSRMLAGPWCASLLPGARSDCCMLQGDHWRCCVAPDVLMTKRHASRG
ncbi:hypothetical protein E0L21_03305 [Kosakonia quasisacchari]|uniref:Uncharacterized protein n=1 Tax=Kosakonia quasisacchari TaxID=2529380 RepID=A0A4R0HW54_9ENTR|nr:hypothetical protein E0L21_03305 [Kosakonia quasisacchari]